jgi:hypothetical protein
MSAPEDIATVLAELRQLAQTVGPIPAHLAAIDEALAKLPQSAEVAALREKVEALEAGFAELKALADGPPPLPDRLLELEEAYRKFVISTGERELGIATVAGLPGDERHDAASAAVAAPLIAESEARTAIPIADMRGRLNEYGTQLAALAKAFRENQSAVLVLTGAAALGLAALVLILISAFGSPIP